MLDEVEHFQMTWIAMLCYPLSSRGDKRTSTISMLPLIIIDRAKSEPDDEEVNCLHYMLSNYGAHHKVQEDTRQLELRPHCTHYLKLAWPACGWYWLLGVLLYPGSGFVPLAGTAPPSSTGLGGKVAQL